MKEYKLTISVKNFDGTAYKQAAKLLLNENGGVDACYPAITKHAAAQIFEGKTSGFFETEYASVEFTVDYCEEKTALDIGNKMHQAFFGGTSRRLGKSIAPKIAAAMKPIPSHMLINVAKNYGVQVKAIPELEYCGFVIKPGNQIPRGCAKKIRQARSAIWRKLVPVGKVEFSVGVFIDSE